MGNFNTKENEKCQSVVRSGSLYYEIMKVVILEERCKALSGEVIIYQLSEEELKKYK